MTDKKSEIIRLNILEKYDVNWSLEFIVRDFVQNYYDSLVGYPQYSFDKNITIFIDHDKKIGTISGPVEFDWEEIKYLGGTTKYDKDKYAGGFGEGFLIACLCLLKLKPAIKISMKSRNIELRPFLDSDGKRREMCFEKINLSTDETIQGSCLSFSLCDYRFLSLLSEGKSFFNYPENPKFIRSIYSNTEKGISIYQYANNEGRIFYRHQDRGTIVSPSSKKNVPFAICYNFQITDIPNARDRIDLDRKSINRVLERTVGFIDSSGAVKKILELTQSDWKEGNIILKYLSDAAFKIAEWNYITKKVSTIIFEFPNTMLADDGRRGDWEIHNLIKRQGFVICPEYMKYFGMTPISHHSEKIKEQEKLENFRNPNTYENEKYALLYDFYDELTGNKANRKPLIVFRSTIKKGEYKSSNIYLNENIFNDFSEFTAVLLHEISHRRGGDDTTGFTDILTMLIKLLLKKPEIINRYKIIWDKLNAKHCNYKNKKISQALLAPFDVQIHQTGCECFYCEKNKYKSFGIGIFNKDLIDDFDEIHKHEPVFVTYGNSFKNAMAAAKKYSEEKGYQIHEYKLS